MIKLIQDIKLIVCSNLKVKRFVLIITLFSIIVTIIVILLILHMDKTQKDKIDCAIYGTNKEQIAKNIIGISKSEVDLILKNCLLDTEIVGVSEIQFDDSSKYHIRINYLGFGNVYFTQDYLASRVDLLYLEPNSKLFQGIISELNTEEDSFQYIYKKEYLPLLADGVIEVTTDTFSDVYNVLVWYSSDLIMVTYGSEERTSIAALIYSNLDEIEGVEKIKETFFNHKSNGVFY